MLKDVYKLAGGMGGSADSPLQADLSDSTFKALQRKIDQMNNLKAQREAHAAELLGILHSLWDAMEVPPSSSERTVFVKMMTSGVRLHIKSLEKVIHEHAGWHGQLF